MPTELRMKRINDRVKEVLSVALLTKAEDLRLASVTVTDVKIDRELDFANIYVSALGGSDVKDEVIEALNHARGFLKFEIANEVELRVMPKLRFFWDPTPERAQRLDELLMQIKADESQKSTEDQKSAEDQQKSLPETD